MTIKDKVEIICFNKDLLGIFYPIRLNLLFNSINYIFTPTTKQLTDLWFKYQLEKILHMRDPQIDE